MSSLEESSRFSSLRGLRSLSLANAEFYDAGLPDVCTLPRLESLDLSNTSVTNLKPLLGLRERLRSLTLHQLKRLEMSTAQVLGVIGQLDALQVSMAEWISTRSPFLYSGSKAMTVVLSVICVLCSTWTSVTINSSHPTWLDNCLDSRESCPPSSPWTCQGGSRCVGRCVEVDVFRLVCVPA